MASSSPISPRSESAPVGSSYDGSVLPVSGGMPEGTRAGLGGDSSTDTSSRQAPLPQRPAAWWAPQIQPQVPVETVASTTLLPQTAGPELVEALVDQVRDAATSALPRRIEVPLSTAPGGTAILHLSRASNGEIRAQLGADTLGTLAWLTQQIDRLRRSDVGFAIRWMPAQMDLRPGPTRGDSLAPRTEDAGDVEVPESDLVPPSQARSGSQRTPV